MKKVLLATLGSSEVQVKKSVLNGNDLFICVDLDNSIKEVSVRSNTDIKIKLKPNRRKKQKNYLELNSARDDGQIIYENYKFFEPILSFPIFGKAFQNFSENSAVDGLWLLYTNQSIEDAKEFRHGDSLFMYKIFKDFFIPKWKQSVELTGLEIKKFVSDIDFWYDEFRSRVKKLYEANRDISELIIFPQGGIDQVNTAITLRLIEFFSDKRKVTVQQIQKPEGVDLKQVVFPIKFVEGMNRRKALALNNSFHFQDLKLFSSNTRIEALSDLANILMTFNLKQFSGKYEAVKDLYKGNVTSSISELRTFVNIPHRNHYGTTHSKLRMKAIYLSAKIKLYQEDYSDFLWRIGTLLEYFLQRQIGFWVGRNVRFGDWYIRYENIDYSTNRTELVRLFDTLKSNNTQEFRNLDKVITSIGKLYKVRNFLLHRAVGIDRSVIEIKLEGESINDLLEKIDEIFDVTPDTYGWFTEIQKAIAIELTKD